MRRFPIPLRGSVIASLPAVLTFLLRLIVIACFAYPALHVAAFQGPQQHVASSFCSAYSTIEEGALHKIELEGITFDELVQKFAQKELLFKFARQAYSYSAQLVIKTLTGDRVDGELVAAGQFGFDDSGQRTGKFLTTSDTLKRIRIPSADKDPYEFNLTPENIAQYDLSFVGQQTIGAEETLVLDVKPKRLEADHEYLEGRIWILRSDYSTIKIVGKSVYSTPGRYSPSGTEWRQLIDGKYWFPACWVADEVLAMRAGKVRVVQMGKYSDYARRRAQTTASSPQGNLGAGDMH